MITVGLNYLLKLTVLTHKPTTALVIATVIATIVSYILNREWSFSARGGRRRHTEIFLFALVNVIAIGITATPQFLARYVFHLEQPHVSFAVQEISDFVNGLVLGTAMAMFFRLWAFRHWVFPAKPSLPERTPAPDLAREPVGVR
ncbi:MAG: GtrA family protein [Micromonosporaceae bacterium]|nr:GtrA family protein [Micromonosporaceae bacterium]